MHVCAHVCMHASVYVHTLCMYVYVCASVCAQIMHVCLCMCMCAYMCIHAIVYVRMRMCMHVWCISVLHVCVCVHVFACTQPCVSCACMYGCVFASMCACMHACIYVCMGMYIYYQMTGCTCSMFVWILYVITFSFLSSRVCFYGKFQAHAQWLVPTGLRVVLFADTVAFSNSRILSVFPSLMHKRVCFFSSFSDLLKVTSKHLQDIHLCESAAARDPPISLCAEKGPRSWLPGPVSAHSVNKDHGHIGRGTQPGSKAGRTGRSSPWQRGPVRCGSKCTKPLGMGHTGRDLLRSQFWE